MLTCFHNFSGHNNPYVPFLLRQATQKQAHIEVYAENAYKTGNYEWCNKAVYLILKKKKNNSIILC